MLSTKNQIQKQLVKIKKANSRSIEKKIEKLEKLSEKHIALDDALAVIGSLNYQYAKREYDFEDTQTDLLRCLRNINDPALVDPLKHVYGELSGEAKGEVIILLSEIDSKDAVYSIFDLLSNDIKNKKTNSICLHGWKNSFIQPEHVFPRLIDFLSTEDYLSEILMTTLLYMENDKIKGSILISYVDLFIEIYDRYAQKINSLDVDREVKNWFYGDEYLEIREDFAILVDLFGFIDDNRIADLLRNSLGNKDPRIVLFSTISLMRKNQQIDKRYCEVIARDPEMRKWFFDYCQKNDCFSCFPKQYLSQEKLAESDMVNWLIFPTELGSAPDDIQLEATVTIDVDSEEAEYFLFKFKVDPPHWASEDGWMAGISGPFIKSKYPTIEDCSGTFSAFEKWEEKSKDEHIQNIRELVGL